MNITKTISLLDELRERIEPKEWVSDHFDDENVYFGTSEEDIGACFDDDSQGTDNAEYIVAIHNSYEVLRQAALDGERYRKASNELVKAIEKIPLEMGNDYRDNLMMVDAISAYRQAVEEK